MKVLISIRSLAAVCVLAASFFALPGCDRKEKIIDIETPGGEVEVEKDKETGEVDVEVDKD